MGLPEPPGGSPVGFLREVAESGPVYGWLAPPPPRSAWQRWGRHLLLFLLTFLSVFLVGSGGVRLVHVPGVGVVATLDWGNGLLLACGLLAILGAHEMGHYVAARYHGVDATLPFFIPSPWIPVYGLAVWMPLSFVGTFGAVIRIRSPIPNRRALFDIGVAGPLAGFAVCLPVLWLGIRQATVQSVTAGAEGQFLGESLLFRLVGHLIHGSLRDDQTLLIGPLGLAAWFGLLVTALNLMPIGQLDGGHVTYSLLRERAHRISRIASWVCVALVYFGPSWILWAILVRVLGRRHPPTRDDELPVGRARVLVGLLSLVVFALCFVADPIVVSWRDLLHETPLGRFLP